MPTNGSSKRSRPEMLLNEPRVRCETLWEFMFEPQYFSRLTRVLYATVITSSKEGVANRSVS